MTSFIRPIKFAPVFSGKTKDDEKIVLYNRLGNETELYLKRADGKLWTLSPESKVEMSFDPFEAILTLSVQSPEWTGKATGTKKDLIEEEAIR